MTDQADTDAMLARLRALRRLIPRRRDALADAIAERRELAQALRARGVSYPELQAATGLTKSGLQRALTDPKGQDA